MKKAERNIGPKGRMERGVAGFALLLLAYASSNWLIFTGLILLGSIMIGEAFSGHCVYHGARKTKDMR